MSPAAETKRLRLGRSMTRAIELAGRVADYRRVGLVTSAAYFVVLVAVGLRYHIVGDGESETDFFGAYVVQARAFLEGRVVVDPYRGPLYPMVLGLLGAALKPLGAGLFEAGIVLSSLSAALVLFLNHRLVREIFTPGIALAGTLLVALNPTFVRYSYTTGNDMFFVFVAVSAVTLALKTRRMSWPLRATALGAVLAIAYLTRYNGAVFLAAACVCIVALDVWRLGWRQRLAAAATVIAVFFFLITPWGIYCQAERGAFFYNQNHLNVVFSLLPEGSSTDHIYGAPMDELRSMADVFRHFWRELLSQLPRRAWHQFAESMGDVMRWPVGAFVVLGLVLLCVRRSSRRQVAYYLFAASFFGVLLLVFYNDRFGLFLLPVYAAIAARGVLLLPDVLGRRRGVKTAAAAILAGVVVFSAVAAVGYNRWWICVGDAKLRVMAEWVVTQVPPHQRGRRVVARKPMFAYFAGLEHVPLPVIQSHDELLRYLHDQQADYLLFGKIAWRTRRELGYLSEYKTKHPGLTLVLATSGGVLYRVEDR